MAVVGVVICEVLGRELATLLAEDPELNRICVLEGAESELGEALELAGDARLDRLPHLRAFRPGPPNHLEAIVQVLPLALHRQRALLRREVGRAAQELAVRAQALLLGYGRCGDALTDLEASLTLPIPICTLLDASGQRVDDCVCLAMGRERYRAEQRAVPGTFFITSGWASRWHQSAPGDPRGLRRLLSGYRRLLLLPTPAMAEAEMRIRVEPLRAQLALEVEVGAANAEPLAAAWGSVKAAVNAREVQP